MSADTEGFITFVGLVVVWVLLLVWMGRGDPVCFHRRHRWTRRYYRKGRG